jgi:glycosyltransferase involved in cell wall biosynthesis
MLKLVCIDSSFPKASFVWNEMKYLCNEFDFVYFINVNSKRETHNFTLPANSNVYYLADEEEFTNTFLEKINLLLKIAKVLGVEYIYSKTKIKLLQHIKYHYSELKQDWFRSKKLLRIVPPVKDVIYYTYWKDNGANMLSWIKKDFPFVKTCSRLHGFDLYAERQPFGYMPYSYFNFNAIDQFFAISEQGKVYAEKNYPIVNPVIVSYLGTESFGMNPTPENDGAYSVCTCSNIIKIKRIGLLMDSLKYSNLKIKWFIIGEGEELQNIINQSQELPENITVEFLKRLTQKQIHDFYLETPVNFFINVSESEGLPVSIMEAIGYGIPVIATNVGGTKEIVNEQTGILMNPDIKAIELKETIDSALLNPAYSSILFRQSVKKNWSGKFCSEINFKDFCDNLKAIEVTDKRMRQ